MKKAANAAFFMPEHSRVGCYIFSEYESGSSHHVIEGIG